MVQETSRREYLVLPLEYCYFDRLRYERLKKELVTEIISFRKYEHGLLRVHFSTREVSEQTSTQRKVSTPSVSRKTTFNQKKIDAETRNHLLWIQLIELDGRQYVKYRCDCKYFEFRQWRVAKRLFKPQEHEGDVLVVVRAQAFEHNRALFNLDKHAFLALYELLHVPITITV